MKLPRRKPASSAFPPADSFVFLRTAEIVLSSGGRFALTITPQPDALDDAPGAPVRPPQPMARPEIHETVAGILGPLPRGRLLDIPAGEGAMAVRLAEAGFQVCACDLYPALFLPPRIEIRQGDLCGTLPYDGAEFEYVVCLEGLEHIENPSHAIREFARVLVPGGHLIVSVPNILNIEERLKWLFYGYTSHFKPISQQHLLYRHEQVGEKTPV